MPTLTEVIAADQSAVEAAQAALDAATAQLAADQAKLDAAQPHLDLLNRIENELASLAERAGDGISDAERSAVDAARRTVGPLVEQMRNLFLNA